jgi:integrase
MSLFKRGEIWWYDFQLNGVRVRESSGLTQRSAAAQAEAIRRADLARGLADTGLSNPCSKFDEFAQKEFAVWSENQHREHPSTHERYMRSVKVLVRHLGQHPLDMISSGDVERFKVVRSKQQRMNAREKRTITPAGVNRDLAVLRILFNLAIRMRKAKMNPAVGVRLLPEHNLRMRVISLEEEAAYLAAASQPLRDMATLILETGMRPGEVLHLRREDVNLEIGFLQIPRGKTPFAQRTIPLTKRAFTVFSRRVSQATTEWLFPSRNDPHRPIGWLRKAHLIALRKVGINPPFRLYDLRHTALTRMAMAGVDLPTLRELAGHASIQMTMRYLHPTPEHKRRAIQKLENFTRDASFITIRHVSV